MRSERVGVEISGEASRYVTSQAAGEGGDGREKAERRGRWRRGEAAREESSVLAAKGSKATGEPVSPVGLVPRISPIRRICRFRYFGCTTEEKRRRASLRCGSACVCVCGSASQASWRLLFSQSSPLGHHRSCYPLAATRPLSLLVCARRRRRRARLLLFSTAATTTRWFDGYNKLGGCISLVCLASTVLQVSTSGSRDDALLARALSLFSACMCAPVFVACLFGVVGVVGRFESWQAAAQSGSDVFVVCPRPLLRLVSYLVVPYRIVLYHIYRLIDVAYDRSLLIPHDIFIRRELLSASQAAAASR